MTGTGRDQSDGGQLQPRLTPSWDRWSYGILALAVVACALAVIVLAKRVAQLREVVSWAVLVTSPSRASVDAQAALRMYGSSVGASVVRVELFTDFACDLCRASAPAIDSVRREVGRSVDWVPRIVAQEPSREPLSFRTAVVAECASEQGRFWDFFAALADSAHFDWTQVEDAIRRARLDRARLGLCTQDKATESRVWRGLFSAAARGIIAAPAIFVDGILVVGRISPDPLRALLHERLRIREVAGQTATRAMPTR